MTLNSPDFPTLLVEHGFTPFAYDFASSMLGFVHEIFNTLIHDDPVFSAQSEIYQQPHSPDAFMRCELITRSGDLVTAIQYFHRQWFTELRYQNPLVEILNLDLREGTATINALMISRYNAMTFLFTIK